MDRPFKEEQKYLEGKLKHNPDSILFARLAEMYLSLDRVEEAIKLCEEGIRRLPSYVTGHYILSKCYLRKNKIENAKKELKRVLYYDPYYIAAHRDSGDLMIKEGWTNKAIESFEKILEVDPLNRTVRSRDQELRNRAGVLPSQQNEDFDIDIDTDLEDRAIEIPDRRSEIGSVEDIFAESNRVQLDNFQERQNADNEGAELFDLVNKIFRENDLDSPTEPEFTSVENQDEPDYKTDLDREEHGKVDEKNFLHEKPSVLNSEDEESKDNLDDDFRDFIEKVKNPPPISSQDSDSLESLAKERESKKSNPEPPSKLVTPTLGEIYISQGQYNKALGVYQLLHKNNPENELYIQKIEFLKKKLEEISQR
ncbi:tetratricopeptide repeat protein [candidate division KSB1 bacterium]|nr:tetratricopeptide repeat protein [candidate division KSB1 bacterium]